MTITQDWFSEFDGQPCGCLFPIPTVPTVHRRFSPFCRLIDVSPSAPQVYFRVAPSVQNDASSLTFNNSRVYLELRRKGMEDLIATYNAWRRDANGYIGFYFDDSLFGGCPGYYVGDIFIDCKYCMSVQLRLPPCETFVTDCYALPALEDCGRGECTVVDLIGMGVIGGLTCDIPPATTVCGPVAPFFDLNNSVPPPPVCGVDSACCFTPATAAGAVPAG